MARMTKKEKKEMEKFTKQVFFWMFCPITIPIWFIKQMSKGKRRRRRR